MNLTVSRRAQGIPCHMRLIRCAGEPHRSGAASDIRKRSPASGAKRDILARKSLAGAGEVLSWLF
jgi:hypothetical protein